MAMLKKASNLVQVLTMIDSLSQEEKVILKNQLERTIWEREFEDLTSWGERHFETWCKTRGIDYKNLEEEDVDRIVAEAVEKNRSRASTNV